MSPHKSGSQGLVVSSLHPTRAGCHTLLCHPRGSGGPALSWDVVWIPAFAGMTASFMSPHKSGSQGLVVSSLHPTRAGCHTLLCHPRGSGGPALSWDVVWIPAFAGMTASFMSPHKSGSQGLVVSSLHPTRAGCHTLLCHRRGSGGPVLSWDVVWIPAFAGKTSSFMSHPQEWESRPGRVLPASHSCGMPYTLVSPPRKRGSSPVVGRRLDSRLSGNDILFHGTPAKEGGQAWSRLPRIPTCAGCHTLLCHPAEAGVQSCRGTSSGFPPSRE